MIMRAVSKGAAACFRLWRISGPGSLHRRLGRLRFANFVVEIYEHRPQIQVRIPLELHSRAEEMSGVVVVQRAAILETESVQEMEEWLGKVENWDLLPIAGLEHALLSGASFPLPGRPFYLEEAGLPAAAAHSRQHPARPEPGTPGRSTSQSGAARAARKYFPAAAPQRYSIPAKTARSGMLYRGLRCGQSRDGYPEGGAGHVGQTYLVAELHSRGVAALLAADAQLDVGTGFPAQLAGHLYQPAHEIAKMQTAAIIKAALAVRSRRPAWKGRPWECRRWCGPGGPETCRPSS